MSPSVHNGVRLDEQDDPAPGFTAVNGRSPPQTLKLSGNGSERRHSRAEATPENDRVQDRRPLSQQPDRPDRPLTPRPPERDARPSSPAKRKRSLYDDDEGADMYSRPAPRMVRQARSSSSSEEEDDEDEEDDDDDEEEDDDTLDDDENGEPSAQTREFAARSQRHTSSAGVDQYVVVSRREDEAVGTSRKDRASDGPQPSESANDYSSTPGYTRAGVQVDKSKRKRQFSKRTKTGCGTCRRRKKKCDEAKPTCNNCVRGGFMCEGYFLKTAWQKPGAPNSHPPLQSKFSYAEHPGIFPRPATETFPNSRQPLSLEEARSRPLLVEDERSSTHSSSSWPAWPPPQTRIAAALRAFPGYSEQNSYPHGQSGSSIAGPSLPQPPHRDSPQPAITAQLAIQQQQQHQQHQPSPLPRIPPPQHKSEKEKMLGGAFFKPSAPELRAQREQCKLALNMFNHAVGSGAKEHEQMDRFWKVLQPPHTEKLSGTINPQGVMGKDCYIDQPFQCEYGFNLRIGKNVRIAKNCMIEDVAEVVIGDGCILGPSVTINTMEWSKNAQDRVEGLATAKMVRLESGVVLGAGVVVMPGTHIKSGSVVEAGTILKGEHDFPRLSYIYGNPPVAEQMWEESRIVRSARRRMAGMDDEN